MIVTISSDSTIDWNAKTKQDKKINQVLNLIKTRKGEIPFLRDLGLSNEYIDNPIPHIKPILTNEIMELIAENVTDTRVLSVDFIGGDESGDFNIKVVCEI